MQELNMMLQKSTKKNLMNMKKMLIVLAALCLMMTAVMGVNAWELEYGDLNDDGNINNRDLALLQQYLNGWDVTLGK